MLDIDIYFRARGNEEILSMLQKIERKKEIGRAKIMTLGKTVDKMLPNEETVKASLLSRWMKHFKEEKMESLLEKVSGVEKVLNLMFIHLLFPKLRKECEALSDIPLATFTSIQKIDTYLQDILLFGTSDEQRGRIFVMGNTGTGKTSFVKTFEKYSKDPEKKKPESFLTEEHKEFEKTEILNVIKNMKLTTSSNVSTESEIINNQFEMIYSKENTANNKNNAININIMDFGGHTEYHVGSKIFFTDNGCYTIMFEADKITSNNYFSRIGTYMNLILQSCSTPIICLMATKMDLAKKKNYFFFSEIKDLSFVLNLAEKQIKFFTEKQVKEQKETDENENTNLVFLYNKGGSIYNPPPTNVFNVIFQQHAPIECIFVLLYGIFKEFCLNKIRVKCIFVG